MSCPLNIVSSGHWIKHEKPEEQLDEIELYIYSKGKVMKSYIDPDDSRHFVIEIYMKQSQKVLCTNRNYKFICEKKEKLLWLDTRENAFEMSICWCENIFIIYKL